MHVESIARRYFEAWNRRDPIAIRQCFAEGGVYGDPVSGDISGEAIVDYAAGLFAAFPDLAFEITDSGLMDAHTVAARWVMRGTNTGLFHGLPPSGKTIVVPGADFIVADASGIRSVRGYFDSRAVPEQLGLQVVVQPRQVGPVALGTCATLSAARAQRPGALSLTSLRVRHEAEVEEVRNYSRQIYREIGAMPGFLSLFTAVAGNRMVTASAWESPEQLKRMYQSPTHQEAMRRMVREDFTDGGVSSVWVPASFGVRRSRCQTCGTMQDYDAADGRCACGVALPDPPSYW